MFPPPEGESTDQSRVLAEVLPGTWRIHASTFPMWLRGKRLEPTFTYTLLSGEPLVLGDEVAYRTPGGRRRRIVGTDRYHRAQGAFVWRGKGLLGAITSRWRLAHLGEDGQVALVVFAKSLLTPAGIDLIGRGAQARPDLRDQVSGDPATVGLSAEQAATLTWL